MTTNSQLSTYESKIQKQKQTTRTGINHRYGDYMEGYQWGGVGREWGKRYRE